MKRRWFFLNWPLIVSLLLMLWVFEGVYGRYAVLFPGRYHGIVIYPLFRIGAYPSFVFVVLGLAAGLGIYWGRKRKLRKLFLFAPVLPLVCAWCLLVGSMVLVEIHHRESLRIGAHTYRLWEITENNIDWYPDSEFALYECDRHGALCRLVYRYYVDAGDDALWLAPYFVDVDAMNFSLHYDRASDTLQVRTALGIVHVIDNVTEAEPDPMRLPDVRPLDVDSVGGMTELAQLPRGTTGQVAWSPDGQHLAVGNQVVGSAVWEPVGVWIYDLAVLEQAPHLIEVKDRGEHGNFRSVESIALSPNGDLLAAGSGDSSVRIWEVGTEEEIAVLSAYYEASIYDAANMVGFDSTGTRLAYSSAYDEVTIYDTQGMQILGGYSPGDSVSSFAFSLDGSTVAVASYGHIQLWAVGSSAPRWEVGTLDRSGSMAFSPDGTLLASIDYDGIVLRDVSTGRRVATLRKGTIYDEDSLCLTFSPDGSLLASGYRDGTIRLWSIPDSRLLGILPGHTRKVKSVAFNPDGSMVASASSDGTIRIWGVPSEAS